MKIFKRILKVIIFAAILAAAAGAFYYWDETKPPEDLRALYQTQTAQYADVTRQVIATGHVRAKDTVSVMLDVSEKVAQVHVKEGEPVDKGQRLIAFDVVSDQMDLERRLSETRLNLRNAELNLESIALPAGRNELLQYTSDVTAAEQNFYMAENDIRSSEIKIAQQQRKADDAQKTRETNETLYESGVITEKEFDLAVSSYENALQTLEDLRLQEEANEQTLLTRQAQLEDARQKRTNAEDKFSDEATVNKYRQQQNAIELIQLQIQQIESDLQKLTHQSVSPIDGYVTSVQIQAGEIAAKGAALVEIADTSMILVAADITEYDAPRLVLGQEADISTSGLPDKNYQGSVAKIAVGAVEKPKTSDDEVVVPVEITVLNPDEQLKTGYTVDIAVMTDKIENALSLPIQAVLIEDAEKYVYVMGEQAASKKVFWKTMEYTEAVLTKMSVETGFYGDKTLEILSGINASDPVVLNPGEVKPPRKTVTEQIKETILDLWPWELKSGDNAQDNPE
ncbi:MAG: efflux RND transporter periplasmic adaptor subunit [Clostridiales bacterium]|jgi:HlyD family secretion protein|nr:efflux RND transporter periplasmic adaptor subunit [Clostridiales bacterium]